jgi:hypothetical protein
VDRRPDPPDPDAGGGLRQPEPGRGRLLAILLLGERRSGLFALGFVAVVTGVLLVNWPARGADRGPASPP